MIDSMFQEGTDKVLDDQVQRLRPTTPVSPSIWTGFATSAPRGIGAAAAETVAFGAELAGAFGDVMGAYPEAMGVTLTDDQKKQAENTRQKLLAQGPSYSSEAGDIFRARAKDIMPDPITTGMAGQITSGLFNFGAKAMGYSLMTGPMAPFLLGGDVGLSEADRLKQQGVDIGTRSKAGMAAGGFAGASIMLPMSGATKFTRFSKGVAIGEGTIVGQSLAEKAILKAGGYDKISDSFDPLDPVALTLGVVPGLVGAKFGHAPVKAREAGATPLTDMTLGQRQALKYNDVQLDAYAVQAAQREGVPPEVLLAVKNAGEKSGPTATSPVGAQGVMQFMPDTFKQFGRGDPMDPMNSIDAGAKYLKQLYGQYGDWDAAIAHYNGGGKAARAVLAGGEVNPETTGYLARTRAYMGKVADDHVAAAGVAEPDLVPAARVQQLADTVDSMRLTSDTDLAGMSSHLDAMERAHEQLAAGERVEVADTLGDHPFDYGRAREAADRYAYLFGDMEPKYDVPQSSQATLRMTAAGMPDIRTDSIHLTDAHPTTRIEAVGENGPADLTRFAIRSTEGAVLGHVELSLKDGKVVSLYDIETNPALRNQGIAAKVIEAITSLEPDRKIDISNIVDAAVPFWEKVGAQVSDGNRSPTLDWHQFAESPAGRSRSAPRRSASLARDAEALDARASEGDQRPASAETRELTAEEAAAFGFPEEPHAQPGTGESKAQPQAAIDRAAAEVSALNPDLLVQLDGMEHPVRVGDLLESVRKEAAETNRDSRLVEVAAACALRNG